jgi:hypothetical protein
MLEGLFSILNPAVPPVPSLKNQREPLEPLNLLVVPLVPPVPPEKTEVKTKSEKTDEPAPATDPLLIEVWTPSGTAMTVRADDAEHAAWLQRMNPKPANPAPKPDPIPEPDGERISEAEHNAAGRYFKFLATWPDGRQCYLCQMPRQTVDEMREQFPDAATIQPIENEDYTDDE